MINQLNIDTLFHQQGVPILPSLRSQRHALVAIDGGGLARILTFLEAMALVEGFEAKVILPVLRAVYAKENEEPAIDEDQAWLLFDEISKRSYESTGRKPCMKSAVDILLKGVTTLSSHMDKSSEMPQAASVRDSFLANLSKKLDCEVNQHGNHDLSVLAGNCDRIHELGRTMSSEDEIELGIVCASQTSFITSAGSAVDAPFQQFLLVRLINIEGELTSMFRLFADGDLATIGQMIGEKSSITELKLKNWITHGSDHQAFIAALFFGIRYLFAGLHEETLKVISLADPRVNSLLPSTLVGTPRGRGSSLIQLPIGEGYHLATPVLNAGLLRDIHELRANVGDRSEAHWDKLFTTIRVGGSKPQNAGIFFSNVVNNGRVNAFYCTLNDQTSGLRVIKKQLRLGLPLFAVSSEMAKAICHRKRQKDISFALEKMNQKTRSEMTSSVDALVKECMNYLAAIAELIEQSKLSIQEFGRVIQHSGASAERAIVLQAATRHSLEAYAQWLQGEIFKRTNMTRAEKRFVARQILQTLIKCCSE